MEIVDEYTEQIYHVPPEEEMIVLRLQQQGATVPEIVEALSLPTPQPAPPEVTGYLPATDGGVISVDEVPELNEGEEV